MRKDIDANKIQFPYEEPDHYKQIRLALQQGLTAEETVAKINEIINAKIRMSLKYTGERLIPGHGNYEEHLNLYKAASIYCHGKTVLDAACGCGWGSRWLLDNGAARVIGADIDEEAVAFARGEYIEDPMTLDFIQADLLNGISFGGTVCDRPWFPPEKYDVIVSIETLEHVSREEGPKLLKVFYDLLKPGGKLIVSTPDGAKFPYHPASPAEYRGFHKWHYTDDELIDILADYGMIITGPVNAAHILAVADKG